MFAHLNLHWYSLVSLNVLLVIGPSVVTVNIFEFISAQSPYSMKGLLLGAFFGIFQFLGSILIPGSSIKFCNIDWGQLSSWHQLSLWVPYSHLSYCTDWFCSILAKTYKYREGHGWQTSWSAFAVGIYMYTIDSESSMLDVASNMCS